jgi:hypothetical protein
MRVAKMYVAEGWTVEGAIYPSHVQSAAQTDGYRSGEECRRLHMVSQMRLHATRILLITWCAHVNHRARDGAVRQLTVRRRPLNLLAEQESNLRSIHRVRYVRVQIRVKMGFQNTETTPHLPTAVLHAFAASAVLLPQT